MDSNPVWRKKKKKKEEEEGRRERRGGGELRTSDCLSFQQEHQAQPNAGQDLQAWRSVCVCGVCVRVCGVCVIWLKAASLIISLAMVRTEAAG